MNLVTVARLQRNPTVKDEMKQKGLKPNKYTYTTIINMYFKMNQNKNAPHF